MKRLPICLVFLLLVGSLPLLAEGGRLVELRVLDQGKPQADVEVKVNYPDTEVSSGKTLTLTTNAKGFVAFDLPERVFWVTVPALNKKVVGREFRVPDDAPGKLHWDLHPREWKAVRKESEP